MKTTFLASDGSSYNFWRESDNFWREEQQMVGSSSGNNPDPVFVATHELKEVTKIRKQFPETWVWSSVSIPYVCIAKELLHISASISTIAH
jgi:hypothetical protein